MSDDAQTIQTALQIIELGGRFSLFLGRNGLPVLKKGAKSLGKIIQVFGALLCTAGKGIARDKHSLANLVEQKGNDLVFFEVTTENRTTLTEMKKQMESYGIMYAEMPDLCGGDGKRQFAISPKDAVRFRMFLRSHADRKKDHTDLPDINIISAEDYANTGYDNQDRPTKELDKILKDAEQEIRKEREAQEKEAQKKGKKPERAATSPGAQVRTCGNLNEALDRYTSKETDQQQDFYVASQNDPRSYIHCRPRKDTYKGEEYIRTEYEVYRDGKFVYKADDRRFDGRPQNYWFDIKKRLEMESGINGKCYMFQSEGDLKKWLDSPHGKEDTVAHDEFFRTFEKQTGPGYVKKIEKENLIKVMDDGNVLVDIPELPGTCLLIDKGSIINDGYLKYKGEKESSLYVRFREDKNYMLMSKETGKTAVMNNEMLGALWRFGSLNKKVSGLNNQLENMRKTHRGASVNLAGELSGSMEEVLSSATKARKR